jgi:hypothetical protein
MWKDMLKVWKWTIIVAGSIVIIALLEIIGGAIARALQ